MISLLHPSRSRSGKAYITYSNWMRKSTNPSGIEHILSLDSDDQERGRYELLFKNSWIIVSDSDCAVKATNEAAKISKGDILIMLSDDFDCPQDWDKLVEDAFSNYYKSLWAFLLKCNPENGHAIAKTSKGAVLKVFDGTQKWIVTLAIMDRAYYERQGYFYFPGYKHLFVDTDLTHKAELEGRLIFRNDIVFNHLHYTRTGAKKDATTLRADATWIQGESLYLQRCKERFGMDETTDIFNLGKEAKESGHLDWLRNKLSGGNARMRLPKRRKLFT